MTSYKTIRCKIFKNEKKNMTIITTLFNVDGYNITFHYLPALKQYILELNVEKIYEVNVKERKHWKGA